MVREVNPGITVADQVNVSSMTRIYAGAPHDFERHSDFLETLSMDLYGIDPDYKHWVKFMQASFGNEKPVGLVWFALARAGSPPEVTSEDRRFPQAGRAKIRDWAASKALALAYFATEST